MRAGTEGHFSFNVPGGRCEKCQGAGVVTVSMHFLPDVQVRCPACRGRRFRREVLEVTYRGRTVAGVLHMTIAEALDEPTSGLHPAYVANLVKVLQGLVDAGNSVVVVEHNLDLVGAGRS